MCKLRLLPAPPHLFRRDALMSTSDPVPALADKVISGGRVNFARALAKVLGVDEPAAPPPTKCKCAGLQRGGGLCRGRPPPLNPGFQPHPLPPSAPPTQPPQTCAPYPTTHPPPICPHCHRCRHVGATGGRALPRARGYPS